MPLGAAEQRGGGEATDLDVGLKRVVLDVVDGGAADPGVENVAERQRTMLLDVRSIERLNVRRHLRPLDAGAFDRRGTDDVRRRERIGRQAFLRLTPRFLGEGAAQGQPADDGGHGDRSDPFHGMRSGDMPSLFSAMICQRNSRRQR
jgi:hypothetical protein